MIPSFGVQEEFKVALKSNLSFDWYIQVCGGLRLGRARVMILHGPGSSSHAVSLPQTPHNHLQVVSKAEILFDASEFTLLPGQDGFVMAQVCVWDTERSLEAGEESGLVGGREGWAGGVSAGPGGDRGQGGVNHGVQGAPRSDRGLSRNPESFFLMYPPPSLLQTETKVESYEVHNPVPLIVGSSVGGLVLLALISAGLYKVTPPGPSSCPLPFPPPLRLTQHCLPGLNSPFCRQLGDLGGRVTEPQFLQLYNETKCK